jgi:hypothetical protein
MQSIVPLEKSFLMYLPFIMECGLLMMCHENSKSREENVVVDAP